MRFILAGSLLAGLNGRSVDLIARNGDARSRQGGRHRQNGDGRRRRASSDVAMRARVGGHRRRLVPSSAMAMLQLDVRGRSSRHRRMRRCSSEAKKPPQGVRGGKSACGSGGRNRAGDQGGKPRGLMCSSATLAGFSTYPMRAARRGRCLDLLLLFSTMLLLWRCCCSSRGTVAKLAMRQPLSYSKALHFKTLLTGAFRVGSPYHNKMLRAGLCVVHASPQYL